MNVFKHLRRHLKKKRLTAAMLTAVWNAISEVRRRLDCWSLKFMCHACLSTTNDAILIEC